MRTAIILLFLGTLLCDCNQEKKFEYNTNWWGLTTDSAYHEIYLLDSVVFVNDSRYIKGYKIISIDRHSLKFDYFPWNDTLAFELTYSKEELIMEASSGFVLKLYKNPIPVKLPSLSPEYYRDITFQDHKGFYLRKQLFFYLLENNLLGTQPSNEDYIIK
jgi:hypothetical protein